MLLENTLETSRPFVQILALLLISCVNLFKSSNTIELSLSSIYGNMMDLEIITLNEINPTEKDKYHVISLICGI